MNQQRNAEMRQRRHIILIYKNSSIMNEVSTLGAIMLWAEQALPAGWANCDGSTIKISDNNALFSILGKRYGGDGQQTFMLPKMSNVGNARFIICTSGAFPSTPKPKSDSYSYSDY